MGSELGNPQSGEVRGPDKGWHGPLGFLGCPLSIPLHDLVNEGEESENLKQSH